MTANDDYIHESCELSCKTVNKWKGKKFDPIMIQDYRMCIDKAMRAFLGIQNQDVIDDFIDHCGSAIRGRMWLSEKEKNKTIDEWADDLWDEVFYCSDRWSWDRLVRTNWIFQRVITLHVSGKRTYTELLA